MTRSAMTRAQIFGGFDYDRIASSKDDSRILGDC